MSGLKPKTMYKSFNPYNQSTTHQMTNDQLKNRLAHIKTDIQIIEKTIKRRVPKILDELNLNITNIYVACDLTNDEVEKEWKTHKSILPTYAEYTKDMSLADKFKMYYDADLDQPISATNLCEEMADALSSPTWLAGFEKDFKNYLWEREYMR